MPRSLPSCGAPALSALFDDATAPRDVLGRIDGIIGPLCMRLRVARRDVERLRPNADRAAPHRFQARKRGGRLPAGLLSRDYGNESWACTHGFIVPAASQPGRLRSRARKRSRPGRCRRPLWLGDDGRPSPLRMGGLRRLTADAAGAGKAAAGVMSER